MVKYMRKHPMNGKYGENMELFDLIKLAKQAQSVEELTALAGKEKIKLSEEDARIYYDRWHGGYELDDDELDAVGGGYGGAGQEKYVCEECGDVLGIDVSEGGFFCYKCNRRRNGIRVSK